MNAAYTRLNPDKLARARLHLLSGLVASSLADNERYQEGLAVLHDAEPIIDNLLAEEPHNPKYIRQKMATANYESQVYDNESGKSLGNPAEALAAAETSLRIFKRGLGPFAQRPSSAVAKGPRAAVSGICSGPQSPIGRRPERTPAGN